MKFTLSWLRDYLETDQDLQKILKALTDLGLEVEGVNNPADRLKQFRVGEIIHTKKHPNADKLKVCEVLTSEGKKQIICGAPNARPGIKVVVAQPGDYIPGIDTTINVGKIRGVESFGMMCSEKELEISDEHEGIIEIDSNINIGERYIDVVKNFDVTIDIAITPNRPDALGVRGIARDLAARGLGKYIEKEILPVKGTFESSVRINLKKDVIDNACELFIGRQIRGVKNTTSPKWLRDRLVAIGLRPISALVDITNFITFDSGRPLHVFDLDKLEDELTVRKAIAGERILALDGNEYELKSEDTVISSGKNVEAIAGVIGGLNSGCNPETTNVLLEAALFSPKSTARTGRRLKINSDARYRFERGVDPNFTFSGIELATQMIIEICGGEASKSIVAGNMREGERYIKLDPNKVDSLIGMQITKNEQAKILRELGFKVKEESEKFIVKVPSWRPDVSGDADLVEEIVRVNSLSKLPGKPLLNFGIGVGKSTLTENQKRNFVLRRKIAAEGLNECITYSFIDQKSAEKFGSDFELVKLSNPISSEMSHMRPSLLPGLCQATYRNQSRSNNDIKIFEIGEVFTGGEPGDQKIHASGVLAGSFIARNAFSAQRPVDVFDCKSVVEQALSEIGVNLEGLLLKRSDLPKYYHPGRAGILMLGPKIKLAYFGELHPKITKFYNLKGSVMGFEILIENVPFPKHKKTLRPSVAISEFQPVERDFAFVVDSGCEVASIQRAIKNADKELISKVMIFDIFEGETAEQQLGSDKKSVAVTVKLQPRQATLTEADLEGVSTKIIEAVNKHTDGVLRS